jgi:DNA polymerase-3 subunit epsilon
MEKICPGMEDHKCEPEIWACLFDPGFPMTPEVIAIHGIEDVDLAGCPKFSEKAAEVVQFLSGVDVLGYSCLGFDIPIIYEELARAGIKWDLSSTHIIDAKNIFFKKEERTLSAALKFYCDEEHVGAHGATADVRATRKVLNGQLARYADLATMTVEELAAYTKMNDNVDLAGKFVRREKDGVVVYNFGTKTKGVPVADDPSLARWMLDKDFSSETKAVAIRLLNEIEAARNIQSSRPTRRTHQDGLPF